MCGIVGMFDYKLEGRADPALIHRMSQVLVHRGPDGGNWRSADL